MNQYLRSIVLGLALLAGTGAAFAQGTVNFINAGAPVRVFGGGLLGNAYLGQLYASATGASWDSFQPVGVPVAFRNNATTGLGTGIVSGGVVTIPASIIATPGGGVWLQLRAWLGAAGGTYEEAARSGISHSHGTSSPFQLSATGNPTTTPPGTPAALTGLTSFTLWTPPEPPPVALVGVGMAIVFLCRRRRG